MRKIHNKINYMVFLFKLHNAKLFVLFIHDVNTKCSSIVLPKYKMGSETLPETTEARFVSLVIVTIRAAKISIGKSFAVFSVDIEFWNDKVKNTIFSVNQVQCDFLHRHIRSIFLCDTNHGHFYCLTSFTQTNHEQNAHGKRATWGKIANRTSVWHWLKWCFVGGKKTLHVIIL